ncbi:MAG TPA: HAD family phosphatase [Pyrinomonadaceae bacterium]|nr:HAD family phosphatase [Pyrinomonadaceae bacterium]
MIKAIFFDFNGVIIDDERLQMAAYQDILREHEVALSESDYFSALGMDDKTFVRAAFERVNKPLAEDLLQVILEEKTLRHRKLIENELPLFPGVVTFLKACSRRFDLGLVSMANNAEISYVLDTAGLRSLFSVIVTADDVSVCKPAPDCYLMGFEKMNAHRLSRRLLPVVPTECLVIEDSPPGVESGRGAGMRTMGVMNTVGEGALRAAGADVVTPSLFDWNVDAVQHVFNQNDE